MSGTCESAVVGPFGMGMVFHEPCHNPCMTGLYGMSNTNHDLEDARSWGKNIFTNTFPISLAQYLSSAKHLEPIYVEAFLDPHGSVGTRNTFKVWDEILQADPQSAQFFFEESFNGYRQFTSTQPEKSDVVVADSEGNHKSAFEIKLTVIPDEATKSRPEDEQACELVFRPTTVEQLAYSLCQSYSGRRQELGDMIGAQLPSPMQFQWTNTEFVKRHTAGVVDLMEQLIVEGIARQSPALIHAIWRTEGTSPVLRRDHCFDVFSWSNFALLAMFVDASRSEHRGEITRPQRSLFWLAKLLFDYASQGHLSRQDTFREMAFNTQTDKAGAFNGNVTLRYLDSRFLISPRIPAVDLQWIISGDGIQHLNPERRLDAAIYFDAWKENRISE